MEKPLEKLSKFNAKGILAENPSAEGRLKYWTNEMCVGRHLMFDFVITV